MVFLKNNEANKLALCIGINYINSNNPLKGCINDVSNVVTFLKNNLNYKDDEVISMTDTSKNTSLQPTKHNILNQLQLILQKIKTDSITHVWLSYSGHGSYVTDEFTGDEIDKRDETLVPMDYKISGTISDDYLYKNFIAMLPKHVTLVSLIDACHSGTMFDLPYKIRSVDQYVSTSRSVQDINKIAKVITISGCQDSQTSIDSKISGMYQGVMTHAFLRVLELYRYNISVKHLVNQMCKYINENGYSQIPVLCCTNINHFSETFIGQDSEHNMKLKIRGDKWCRSETTWNILCVDSGDYLYDKFMEFDVGNEYIDVHLYLLDGTYELVVRDAYGDGGLVIEIDIMTMSQNTTTTVSFDSGYNKKYSFIINN